MSDIAWSRDTNILLMSAQRTLGSVIDRMMKARPDWVVLMRAESWSDRPLMYAFRPKDLLSVDPSQYELMAQDALGLHEPDESPPVRIGEEPADMVPQSAQVSAGRAVLLDADGELVAVGELRTPELELEKGFESTFDDDLDLGPMRSGGTVKPDEATPTSAGDGTTVEALLTAEAPGEIAVGEEAPIMVAVGLTSEILPFAGGAITTSVSTQEQIMAIITVSGGVEAVNPRILKLAPPKSGSPSESAFVVRGRSPGRARIGIIFRQGGADLGTLTLATSVVEGGAAADSDTVKAQAVSAAHDEGEDEGLLLLVDEVAQGGSIHYRYLVTSSALGFDYAQFLSAPLKVGGGNASVAQSYVESIYKQITERVLRNTGDLRAFSRELRAIGVDLCSQLIPSDLARQLWAKRADIGGVLVRSWEPYVPWELLVLRNPDSQQNEADDRFLAEYNLVRSLNERTRPRRLSLRDWSYVAARYDSGYATSVGTEALEYLNTELPTRHGIRPSSIEPTVNAVLDALSNPSFDVLHIACHGAADHSNIDRSSLIIGDRPGGAGNAEPITIDARTVSGEANLWKRNPLVFLNACESGRLGASLTEWGGWPKTFWDRGAGAFVGTSWPVREKPARVFAEAFYETLLGGKTLAEAAGAARAASKPLGDASWLAYKVYGEPQARKA
jgi:hypothetical protein